MKAKVIGTVLVCVLLIVTGISCKGGGGGIANIDGMTAPEVLAKWYEAEYDTARLLMDMHMTTGEGEEEEEFMTMSIVGSMDVANEEMYLLTEATVNLYGVPEKTESSVYMVDDWLYSGEDMGYGMDWCKESVSEEDWGDYDVTDEQLSLLNNYTEVTFLGTEVNQGIDCYKIDVKPDLTTLMGWAMTEGEMDGIELDDFSMTVWIAKETFYLVEMDVDMAIKVEGLADRMFMFMTMTMYSFDSPVFISLPAEAVDAYEGCYSYEESY